MRRRKIIFGGSDDNQAKKAILDYCYRRRSILRLRRSSVRIQRTRIHHVDCHRLAMRYLCNFLLSHGGLVFRCFHENEARMGMESATRRDWIYHGVVRRAMCKYCTDMHVHFEDAEIANLYALYCDNGLTSRFSGSPLYAQNDEYPCSSN